MLATLWWFAWWLVSGALAQEAPASSPAAPIEVRDVPPELEPWIPWVTSRNPDLACPVGPSGRACVWPGTLTVEAGARQGRWRLGLHVDREVRVALPGGGGTWPQDVRIDGRPTPVSDEGGVPTTVVRAGSHTLTARLDYTTRPASLPLPRTIGIVALTVDGRAVPFPRIDSDGLRLGATSEDPREGEHLGIEVNRRIADGVPVVVETALAMRASGRGREVDLGTVLLPGTRAVRLSADLPARFTSDGHLVVQVRPGTYTVRFDALHEGPVDALTRPPSEAPWPDTETWVVQTDDRVRAVNLDGVPGIDPSRTTLPEAWRNLPAFAVEANATLAFETLRRGDPDPAPNQLRLRRTLWLDLDGRGLTARDQFEGRMSRDWRLDVTAPFVVGHVAADAEDLVVTVSEQGAVGVELRNETVNLVAESRIEERPAKFPAVGWAADVVQLDTELWLPPGFRLFTGTGVDRIVGSMVDAWSLFDLFFVLVLAMATGRLFGWPWGVAALIALALARHEADAPQWTWAIVLVLVALHRVVRDGTPGQVVRGLRIVALLGLTAQLVPFAVLHLENGLFPSLESRYEGPDYFGLAAESAYELDAGLRSEAPIDQGVVRKKESPQKDAFLSKQVDPKAVAQTGPGVPNWRFRSVQLIWSGPVSQAQNVRLVVLSPMTNRLLAFLRVVLLAALAIKLAELRRPPLDTGRGVIAGVVAFFVLGWTPPAHAAPSPALLDQLEARLAEPSCGATCVTVPRASLRVANDQLTLTAEVHARAAASWPVPGPTKVFVPSRVTVDGRPAKALARLADGFLHVRLDKGVHRVGVTGPIPPVDAVPLAFGSAPKQLTWAGEGWALDGLRADGSVEASVQLARMLGEASTSQSTENLTPWLEVDRTLDLGLPWRVRTVVRRAGPTDYPVSLKVPLLAGEAVTEGGFEAGDGVVSVSLDRDEREVSWLSTIPTTARIDLSAPRNVRWTEVWTLSCSPLFACTTEGPAPLSHLEDGRYKPTWRVWPGEQLRIDVSRPAGAEGQTTTIDEVQAVFRPGRRNLLAELTLRIRSSQGGRQVLTLPEGAALQSVTLNGVERPLQLRDGRTLPIPLTPGLQRVVVKWQQADAAQVVDTMPTLDLGGPAVNVRTVVEPSPDRWLVWLWSSETRWGPVALMWVYVVVVIALGPLLARLRHSPLSTPAWILLGLGMTQVHVLAPLVVVGWLFAVAWRKEHPARSVVVYNLVQVGLVVLTVAALGCLYAAIHTGLLWQPDSQVAGAASTDQRLVWFVDRVTRTALRPTVISLPMGVWRVVMLAWSLWLAASLVRWLPWAFDAWSTGGMLRGSSTSKHDEPDR